MARRWTGDDEQSPGWLAYASSGAWPRAVRLQASRIVVASLLSILAVAVLLGASSPFLATAFVIVFGLLAVQAALDSPAEVADLTRHQDR